MKRNNRYFYYILIIIIAVTWGSAYPVVRWLTLSGADPLVIASLRISLSVPFALLMLLCSREKLDFPAMRKYFPSFFLLGLTGVVGFFLLMAIGLQYTNAGKGALIACSSPIIIGILSHFLLKEKLSTLKLIGILCAVVGVFFTVVGADLLAGTPLVFYPADMLLLLACFCWAIYTMVGRVRFHYLGLYQGFALIQVCSFLMMLPLVIVKWDAIMALDLQQWLWIAFLGVFPGGIGFVMWNKCVNALGASVCGIFNSFTPMFSVILATIFLNEVMAWPQLMGGALVIGGVLMGIRHVKLPVNYETGESLE